MDFNDIICNAHKWLQDINEDLQTLQLNTKENKITKVTPQWSEASEGYHYKIYYWENNLPYVNHEVLYKISYDGSKRYSEREIIPTIQKEVIKIAKAIKVSEPVFSDIPFIELEPSY